MRSTLERTGDSMATEFAAIAMEAWAKRRVRTFQDAEQRALLRAADARRALAAALRRPALGARRASRSCSSSTGRRRRRGRSTRRRPPDPQRVTQRRRYRTDRRRIVDISDESLDGTAVEGASVSDFLLEELERRREGRMRDIVATIQSDQYRLITAEPEGALVVQGGPGTGKTAVGLHRASWLLYTHREQLRRVLVVGPNPTFMDYVSHVLPALGEEAVEQRAVSELLDGIVVGARGRARRRAAEGGHAARGGRAARASSSRCSRSRRSSCSTSTACSSRCASGRCASCSTRRSSRASSLAQARERFRMARAAPLLRALRRAARAISRCAASTRSSARCSRNGFLTKYLDRVLALPRAGQARRAAADVAGGARGGGGRDPRRATSRSCCCATGRSAPPTSRWSEHDLPLLDVARTLVDGPPRAFGHVIVDEAQDLSPMQLLDGVAARARRLADDARRRRAGDRPGRLPALAGARAVPARPGRGDDRGAAARVPRAGRDHGVRAAAARPDRARDRAAALVPAGRRPAAARRGRRGRAARRRDPRGARSSTACSP